MMLKHFIQLFLIGFILRFVCWIYAPQSFLRSIAHAANEDWDRVQEEISLFKNPEVTNESLALNQPPLVLFFWKLLDRFNNKGVVFFIFEVFTLTSFMVFDFSMGYLEKAEKSNVWLPTATFVYAINPYSIFSFAINSVGILSTLVTCWTFIAITADMTVFASILCAIGCYIHIYPGYLLLAVLAQVHQKPDRLFFAVLAFVSTLGLMLTLSFIVVGHNWEFLFNSYLSNVFALNTTPNLGVFWYMYVEMFDHFNTFFVCTIQLIIFSSCVGLALRFYENPLFLALVLTMTTGILRPYNSIAEFGCSLALASHWRHLIKYYKNAFMTVCCLFVALILSPLFHYTWLVTATSNANFYFSACLIHGVARVQIASKLMGAYLKDNFKQKFGPNPCLSNGIRLAPDLKM